MIYRLVGFYEYMNALNHFDKLLQTSNRAELEAMDQIVRERDEYAVFTNVSRRLQTGASPLAEMPQSASDNFERRGLAWVVALARVELGAMLAGYSDAPQPFAVVRPSQFEFDQYRELLADGTRTHYWSLARDPAMPMVIAKSAKQPDHQTLAYVRRLSLARKFLLAANEAGSEQYDEPQRRELALWKNNLDQTLSGLSNNIHRYLQRNQASFTNTAVLAESQRELVRACGSQLRGEAAELRAGTARIETIKSPGSP